MYGDEKVETHPSFGLIGFNRSNGGHQRFFGSPLDNHQTYMTMRVYTGVKAITDDTGQERYYAPNKPSVEVRMTAAQFAEMITSMNVGFGVPCTVTCDHHESVEKTPVRKQSHEAVRESYEQLIRKSADGLREERRKLAATLAASKMSQKLQEKILAPFDAAIMDMSSNAAYRLELFEEAAQKVVGAAKAEVDAFMTHAIHVAGIKAIKAEGGVLSLPSTKEKDDE